MRFSIILISNQLHWQSLKKINNIMLEKSKHEIVVTLIEIITYNKKGLFRIQRHWDLITKNEVYENYIYSH